MRLITISGPMGAGKSTSVRYVAEVCYGLNMKTKTVLWNHLGVSVRLHRLSTRLKRKRIGDEKDVGKVSGELENFALAEDLTNWKPSVFVRARRVLTNLFDVATTWFYVLGCRMRGSDVLICDRYFYDRFVRFGRGKVVSIGTRLVMGLAPTPDIGMILEISPKEGVSRRGITRGWYEQVSKLYTEIAEWRMEVRIIASGSLAEMQESIEQCVYNIFDSVD